MITPEIEQALSGYFAEMQKPVTLVLQSGDHEKRAEQVKFLTRISNISENVSFEERDAGLRSPISFSLEVGGEPSGVLFSGIPGGHEFNSLILAILHASGNEMKLDHSIANMIRQASKPLQFEAFVSLSCHNCPDVIQVLNQFALLNPHISSEMIDGGLFPKIIEERDIQGVPSVYLNGELFANGKVDAAQLLDKLIEVEPEIAQATVETQPTLPLQDVTVIGGGPAGVAAAIYSARKGLVVTLIADRLGGQVKDTVGIENLISIPRTTGPKLAGAFQNHLNDYDIRVKEHLRVTKVVNGDIKILTLSTGEQISTRTLIVATGAHWRELGVPGEKENVGNGVAYCPHCDGPFFKHRDVAVIGGGNSGIEAALDLAGIVKSVTVYEFLPELKADRVLLDQAGKRDNITIKKNVATKQIIAQEGKVSAIEYADRKTGQLHKDNLAGIFIQIGLVPNSQVIGDLIETRPGGEIIVNEKCETSEPGIYACGDVTTVPYKQIVIAMGEGAKASLAAFEYLLTHEAEDVGIDKVA